MILSLFEVYLSKLRVPVLLHACFLTAQLECIINILFIHLFIHVVLARSHLLRVCTNATSSKWPTLITLKLKYPLLIVPPYFPHCAPFFCFTWHLLIYTFLIYYLCSLLYLTFLQNVSSILSAELLMGPKNLEQCLGHSRSSTLCMRHGAKHVETSKDGSAVSSTLKEPRVWP